MKLIKFKVMKKFLFALATLVFVATFSTSCSKEKESGKPISFVMSVETTSSSFTVTFTDVKNVDEAKYILHYEGVSDFTQILTPDYIFNQGSPLDLTKPFTETVPANTNLQLWVAARNSSGASVAKAITFKTKP